MEPFRALWERLMAGGIAAGAPNGDTLSKLLVSPPLPRLFQVSLTSEVENHLLYLLTKVSSCVW